MYKPRKVAYGVKCTLAIDFCLSLNAGGEEENVKTKGRWLQRCKPEVYTRESCITLKLWRGANPKAENIA